LWLHTRHTATRYDWKDRGKPRQVPDRINRYHRRAFVNTAIKFWIPQLQKNFSIRSVADGFSSNTLHYEVRSKDFCIMICDTVLSGSCPVYLGYRNVLFSDYVRKATVLLDCLSISDFAYITHKTCQYYHHHHHRYSYHYSCCYYHHYLYYSYYYYCYYSNH
jgi:hypothetical protein